MKWHPAFGVVLGLSLWIPFQVWWGRLDGLLHWQAIIALVGSSIFGWNCGSWWGRVRRGHN